MNRLALVVTGDRHATDDEASALRWRSLIIRHLSVLVQRYGWIVLPHGACGENAGESGDMRGIDALWHQTGREMRAIAVVPVPAAWGGRGKAVQQSAGPARNVLMLDTQEMLSRHGYDRLTLGYHDDLPGSRGTGGCLRASRQRGVKTHAFRSDGSEW